MCDGLYVRCDEPANQMNAETFNVTHAYDFVEPWYAIRALLWTQSTIESMKAALSKGMRSSIFSPMPA